MNHALRVAVAAAAFAALPITTVLSPGCTAGGDACTDDESFSVPSSGEEVFEGTVCAGAEHTFRLPWAEVELDVEGDESLQLFHGDDELDVLPEGSADLSCSTRDLVVSAPEEGSYTVWLTTRDSCPDE